jgi:hypothetical protein
MVPPFDQTGNLPPGIYWVTWKELVSAFGFTPRRMRLLNGLKAALALLKTARCRSVYIDGSFVTAKPQSRDFDACWAIEGVDPDVLDPVFLDFSHARATQKARFLGEFFPAIFPKGSQAKRFWSSFKLTKTPAPPKAL